MIKLTQSTKPIKEKQIVRNWHLINIENQVLGRTTSIIAKLLQGKHKTSYVPYLDQGDYVVVINSQKVTLTGKKNENKEQTHYSGYPGGLRKVKLSVLREKNPERIIIQAVSGMLPKNKFRNKRLKRLFVFKDSNHNFKDKFKN
jgi:large subunit ribosomal protein L13